MENVGPSPKDHLQVIPRDLPGSMEFSQKHASWTQLEENSKTWGDMDKDMK